VLLDDGGKVGTLWDLVRWRAARTPDAVLAQDEHSRTLTFAGIQTAAERTAAALAGLGVGTGSTVVWQLPTRLEAIVLTAALARLGATQAPVLPAYRRRELSFVTTQTVPELLIVPLRHRGFDHAALGRDLAAGLDGMRLLVVDGDLPAGDPATLPPAPADADEARWLYYTSGTTGEPKGVRHTDASIIAAAGAMCEGFGIGAGDRVPVVFPFTHIGGAVWLALTLMSGCTDIILETFDPSSTLEGLSAAGVTFAGGGTVFCSMALTRQHAHPDQRLYRQARAFMAGAAPKPADMYDDILATFGVPLLTSYGLTECPIATCATPADPAPKLRSTEGRPSPGVQIRVTRADGSEAEPGEVGELLVRGPQLFAGYTASGLNAEAFDADGRFRTGDLGFLDAQGYLTITGRLKDVIIRNGETIGAWEIEEMIASHPAVAEVVVVGLPDPATGERVCAVVVPVQGARPTLAELVTHLRAAGLMTQKLPERLEIVDALPRNAAGKVPKHQLRERWIPGAGQPPAGQPPA
jgi:acyl-CoA synthetase (AMP-forming)/AMP-acid ligase II